MTPLNRGKLPNSFLEGSTNALSKKDLKSRNLLIIPTDIKLDNQILAEILANQLSLVLPLLSIHIDQSAFIPERVMNPGIW